MLYLAEKKLHIAESSQTVVKEDAVDIALAAKPGKIPRKRHPQL